MATRYLITGALGCIGAWTITQLVERGDTVVAADIGDDRSRLRLVSGDRSIEDEVVFARADITDLKALETLAVDAKIDRIIHLAALQVPASHANPPAGAMVNVVGTTNVFDVARRTDVENIVFASSVAAYGPELVGEDTVPNDADQNPSNFYGVFKRADEAVAKLFHDHYGVKSVGLRPHTVFGPGRDTGMTSSPTWAMLAATKGLDYEIPFSGMAGLQHASDVARIFIQASDERGDGTTYSIQGSVADMSTVANLINERSSAGEVSVSGNPLPFPASLDDGPLRSLLGDIPNRDIEIGIKDTMDHFLAADPDLVPQLPEDSK